MMDYEWGNPSTIMLTGDGEPAQDSGQTPLNIFDHYSDQTFSHNLINPNQNGLNNHPNHNHFHHPQTQNTHFQSLYDPRTYGASYAPPGVETISFEPVHSGPTGYVIVPKSEPAGIDYTSRIGLNLGGRTYFSSSENDFVDRLYRRSSAHEPGSVNSPRCQAEGCNADLTHAKHYHRRHKVCEFHSKASTVIAGGLTQRFCQQCSRFHLLPEFDKAKRSCRRRLADHNRRRRKNQQTNQAADRNKSRLQNAHNYSSSENQLTRSPPDSGVQSSSSVTMAISPPGINSLGSSRQRSYEAPSSSLSTTSLFFSNG